MAAMTIVRFSTLLVLLATVTGCSTAGRHLAIANGNHLRVVNADTGQEVQDVTRYQEVMRLAYRPDGERLAVGVCFGNRIVELETAGYTELAAPISASSCPWDTSYSPDGASLAATTPVRPTPPEALFGHLRIAGPETLDRELGLPLLALAYRPGGGEIAVATPQDVSIVGTGPGFPGQPGAPSIPARALAYTVDGSRLIAGTGNGFVVLDATQGYALALPPDTAGSVLDIAVAPSGGWIALVRGSSVSVRRSTDLVEVASITSSVGFRSADFSRDGALLAVAEQQNAVRLFRAPAWQEQPALPLTGRVDAVAFRPRDVAARLPVLFVHGASSGVGPTWFEPGVDTSVAAGLAANPQLPIDAFYIEMPVHGGGQNTTRTIAEDAEDILAMIEGGPDSRGGTQVGILNMPAYQAVGKVAIVGYSLGTMSTRYYLKNLMGTRRNGAITVSEFVALASPNHGAASVVVACDDLNQPDRVARQLCGGRHRHPGERDRRVRLRRAVDAGGVHHESARRSRVPRDPQRPSPRRQLPGHAGRTRRGAEQPADDRRRRALRQLLRLRQRRPPGGRPHPDGRLPRPQAGPQPRAGRGQQRDHRRARRHPERRHARELPPPLADHLHGAADGGRSPGAGRPGGGVRRAHAPVGGGVTTEQRRMVS